MVLGPRWPQGPGGVVHLGYGLAAGTPAIGDLSAPDRGAGCEG